MIANYMTEDPTHGYASRHTPRWTQQIDRGRAVLHRSHVFDISSVAYLAGEYDNVGRRLIF
jgi:hypothetical protein